MDRKSIIILAAAVGLLLVMSPLVDHFFPPKLAPIPLKATNFVSSSTSAASNPGGNPSNTAVPSTSPSPTPASPVPGKSESSGPEQIVTVSNADLIWHFTSRGGGLKDVELTHYPAVVRQPGKTVPTNELACLNHNAPLPVLAVTGSGLQGDAGFTLTRSGNTIRAEKTLNTGLRLVKEFEPGTNFLFKAHLTLENTSDQPMRVPDYNVIIGTATAIGPLDDPTTMGAFWYNGVKSQNIQEKWFANRTLGCIPGTPRWHYEDGVNNVNWAAVDNQFFALAAIPTNPAPQLVIDKIRVEPPDLTGPTNSMSALLTNGYQTAFVYTGATLAPHKSVELSYTFYAGPKEYKVLAEIGQEMNNNLDLIMDFSGPIGFFSKLMLLAMNGLHALGLQYGMTIIALTIIIKTLMWPLTNAANKSQKRMQALQPQLKAINDKYKDDATKKNEKTMEFYKQNKVNPMGSCLPTVLQLPVFFGFYYMLRGAIELRGAHFLWAFDLSQPDTVAMIAGFPVNPLPLIMGATQLWQSHTMPPSPGMDESQQKMMRWMPVLMIALFYRMSAGLTLYWTISNLLSILQLKLTRSADSQAPAPTPVPVKKKK